MSIMFRREWEMPNKNTFRIASINRLIHKYFNSGLLSVDPFANTCRLAKITNDLNPEMNTDFCMDALDFLKTFEKSCIDFVFYDPPYSPRQVSECYKNFGKEVTMQTTQSSWRSNHLDEISRIMKPEGILMCFGWNSNGAGMSRGFELMDGLIVAHGGAHNDTIVTVEQKKKTLFQ